MRTRLANLKYLRIGIIALLLAVLVIPSIPLFHFEVGAVDVAHYWYGGSGNWSDFATHWSYNSGNSPAAPASEAPTANDSAVFDSLSDSGGAAFTVTLNTTGNCNDMDWSGIDVLAILATTNQTLNVYGSLTLDINLTLTTALWGNPIIFKATAAGKTITTAGRSFYGVTFNGVGGEWTLQDAMTIVSSGNPGIVLTNGSLITNNKTITAPIFDISGATIRSLTLGTSTINLTNSWIATTTTNLTASLASSTIVMTRANDADFDGGGLTYGTVSFSSTAQAINILSAGTYTNLSVSGANTYTDSITFAADQVVTGTLTLTGYSVTKRLRVQSSVAGTSRQLTAAARAITNCNLSDIAAGNPTWDISAGMNSDYGGNYGITFSTALTSYWVGNSGTWEDVTHWASASNGLGGTGRVPLVQDTAIFDDHSFSIPARTVTIALTDMPALNASTVTNTPTFSKAGTVNFYGDVNIGTLIYSITTTYFSGFDTSLISSSTLTTNLYINKTVATMNTLYLGGNVTVVGTVYLLSGVFNAQAFNLTASYFDSSTTTYTRVLRMGSGTWTLNGTAATTKWNVNATSLSLYCETSTLILTNSTANAQTFAGASLTYYTVRIQGAGNYTTTFSGNNVATLLYIDRSVAAKTIAGNVTWTVGSLYIPKSGVTVLTISDVDFIKTTGLVSSDYLSFTSGNNTCTAGTVMFYAGSHSLGDPQAGWTFGSPGLPTITTDPATVPTLTSATLNANLTSLGDYDTLDVGFEYGKTVAYGTYTSFQTGIIVIGAVTGRRISGLEAGETYHFRAVVRYNGEYIAIGLDRTLIALITTVPTADTGTPIVTTVPGAIPNMYDEGETGGLFGLGAVINPTLATAGIPESMFWYPIAFLVAIVLGFIAFGFTRQLIVQAVVSGIVMAFFCGGGILGDGLLPYWTVFLFIVETIMLVIIRERQNA